MKNKILTLSISVAVALLALTVLFWFTGETRASVSQDLRVLRDLGGLMDTPTITNVHPNSAPNDIDTPIVIQGTGFTATISGTQVITAPLVYLGDDALPNVIWGNTTTLSSTVPWGLVPEVYSLTVVNPDGVSTTLQNAFTITEGFGVFTTDGPYGGRVYEILVDPVTQGIVYSTLPSVGV